MKLSTTVKLIVAGIAVAFLGAGNAAEHTLPTEYNLKLEKSDCNVALCEEPANKACAAKAAEVGFPHKRAEIVSTNCENHSEGCPEIPGVRRCKKWTSLICGYKCVVQLP